MTHPKPRTAVYLRVSTLPQLRKFGPAAQREEARLYAERMGLEVHEVYQDAITGKSESREALERLLGDAARYDAVLISGVDRLARRVSVAYSILEELTETGLELHSADMGEVNLEEDGSSLNFGVRAVMADAAHRKLVKSMLDGRRRKVAGDARAGVPGVPTNTLNNYGYRFGQPFEPEAQWVRWLYHQALEHGATALCAQLEAQGVQPPRAGHWSRATVYDLLTNPLYRGVYTFARAKSPSVKRKSAPLECPCPALVDEALWHAVQRALRARRHGGSRGGRRSGAYPLTGRIACRVCGRGMTGRRSGPGGGWHYYACSDAQAAPHLKRGCTHRRHYPTEALHALVLERLRAARDDADALSAVLPVRSYVPPDRTLERADLEKRLERVRAAYAAGVDTLEEYAAKKRELEAKVRALETPAEPLPLPSLELARARLVDALEGPLEAAARRLNLKVFIDGEGRVFIALDVV